jgi:putative tricarboxylic transport membrane protein
LDETKESAAASVRTVDLVTAAAIFLVGLVVIWDSVRLGFRWGPDGPAAGYFPFYIGLILCLSSVVNFAQAWIRRRHVSFVSRASFKTVLSVILPTIVYVGLIGGVGPVPGLGIYVASAIFIAMFMVWLGKYRWGLTSAVSIAVPIAFFVLFEVWFKVPLPKGPLETALGLA